MSRSQRRKRNTQGKHKVSTRLDKLIAVGTDHNNRYIQRTKRKSIALPSLYVDNLTETRLRGGRKKKTTQRDIAGQFFELHKKIK